jgi:FkbM family methyltransferase
MISSIREGLFNAAQAIGYTVVPNWRMERYPQTVYLRKLFGALGTDCVLDVGANLGQYRDFLRREVGFRGKIVSFEPIPAHANALRKRARQDSDWIIEGCALGASSETAILNVMSSTTFSSFLQPRHSVQRFKESNDVRERIEVPVKTLDELLPALTQSIGFQSPYLKLDTQGFDLEVVRGAGQSMQQMRALQTEASVRPIYEGMPNFSTVLQTLEAHGFEPSGIFPNNDGHFPLLIDFDFHMINGRFCKELA